MRICNEAADMPIIGLSLQGEIIGYLPQTSITTRYSGTWNVKCAGKAARATVVEHSNIPVEHRDIVVEHQNLISDRRDCEKNGRF
jgi:hypothetical protein